MKYWPFKVIEGEDSTPMYHWQNGEDQNDRRTYQPEDISSKVLIKLIGAAKDKLGEGAKVNKCVLTIPAYFNERQIEATRSAC